MSRFITLLLGLVITLSAQNVGIGLPTPSARLHILVPNGWTTNLLQVEEDGVGYPYLIVESGGSVGIGTLPDPSAVLDINSANKGVLFPRVALTSAVDNTTIPSPAEGLTVYNTSYAGTGSDIITPGLYYWDGSRWTRMNNKQLILATWPTSITNDTLTTHPTFHYTVTKLILPPGKWLVCATILITASSTPSGGTPLVNGEAVWVRSSFSESNTTFSITSDIVGAPLISGDQVGPSRFGICSGCVVINNQTASTKTYYYWGSVEKYNTTKSPRNFGKRYWGEDQLYAIPLN